MRKVAMLAAAGLIATAPSFAETGFYLSVKDFDWKEREGGKELVHESGKLVGIGYAGEGTSFRLFDRRDRFELYGKSVDYVGHAQDGQGNFYPANTTTRYLGLNYELDLGKKVKVEKVAIPFTVMPYAGIGFDFWIRSVDDAKVVIDGEEETVIGLTEAYFVGYVPVGVALKTEYRGVDITAYGQYNYNFYIREKVDFYDIHTLKPKRGNAYRLGVKAGYKTFFAEAFYDYLHFKRSDEVVIADDEGNLSKIYQPDSKRTMIGINIGLRF